MSIYIDVIILGYKWIIILNMFFLKDPPQRTTTSSSLDTLLPLETC